MAKRELSEKQKAYLFSDNNISRLNKHAKSCKGNLAWNSGLTKDNNSRIADYGKKIKANAKNNPHFGNRNKLLSIEHRKKIQEAQLKNITPELIKRARLMGKANKGIKQSAETCKKKSKPGKLSPFYGKKHTKKAREIISEKAKARWKNPETMRIHKKNLPKRLAGLFKRPTSYEQFVIDICETHKLPFKYVGNGQLIINYVNPDFIYEDRKLIIETYSKWCHHERYEEIRNNRFKKFGYKTLFLSDNDIRSPNSIDICLGKINKFLEVDRNGNKMFDIKDTNRFYKGSNFSKKPTTCKGRIT